MINRFIRKHFCKSSPWAVGKEQQLYLQANKVHDGVKISKKTVTVMLKSKGVN